MAHSYHFRVLLVLPFAAALSMTGCGAGDTETSHSQSPNPPAASLNASPPKGPASGSQDDSKQSAEAAADAQWPEELAEQILRSAGIPVPPGTTASEALGLAVVDQWKNLESAGWTLASNEATADERLDAATAKFNALYTLAHFKQKDADRKLVQFAPEAVRIVDEAMAGPLDEPLREVAAALRLNTLYIIASQDERDAPRLLEALDEAGKDKSENVARLARELIVQHYLARLFAGHSEDALALVAAVEAMFASGAVDDGFFPLAQQAVEALEQAGQVGPGRSLAALAGKHFAASQDAELVELASTWSESAARRLGMVGKPVQIVGQTPDGRSFDSRQLRGKVVLVDFWATWCKPCLVLMPRLKALHAKHRERGFEVIGVSLDSNREQLAAFLAKNKLPWPIVADALAERDAGTSESNAERYGIEYLPLMILVDKNGNAAALNLHGAALEAKIEELLE